MKYYAGIGSRETPDKILGIMFATAAHLSKRGYTLRSGGAEGADSAFEAGCRFLDGPKEIYIPWEGFHKNPDKDTIIVDNKYALEKASEIAQDIHPAWWKCSSGARDLHTRNVFQVLGQSLSLQCEFVVCWTKNAEDKGGTRTAIILARQNGIPVYNLASKMQMKEFLEKIYANT